MKFSIAKFAKKKFFVPGIVIALVVIGWLILLIAENMPSEKPTKIEEFTATWSPKEDYVIKETPEGTFVENEKAGLTFKVPEGWLTEINDTTVSLLNKEITSGETHKNISPKKLIEKEACLITTNTGELGSNTSEPHVALVVLNKQISSLEQSPNTSGYYQLIIVGGHKGLKTGGNDQFYISVEVPIGNKLYRFELYNYSKGEKCSQEFDKFLATVSIR